MSSLNYFWSIQYFDKIVKELNLANILVYRYDARGYGKSEGKRGFLNTMLELVEDLWVVLNLAKKENPNLPIFLIGHSMRGHTCALFGAKYPNQVKGIILCAAMLKDKIHIFFRYNFALFDSIFHSLISPKIITNLLMKKKLVNAFYD